MTEPMLHLYHRKSVCQQIAGGAVPQIVQPHRWQITFCHNVVKNAGNVVGCDGIAVRPGEHKIGLHIGIAEKYFVLLLSDEIARSIRHLNADVVVNTSKESIVEVLKQQLEEGHPVDVAIDCLGGEIMGQCIHYLKHGARWIMIAALAGQKTEIDLKNIYVRNVRIIGSNLRSRTPEVKAQILASLVREVWPKVESGEVKPTIYRVLPITEAEAAHDILYKGQNIGKVVLIVD